MLSKFYIQTSVDAATKRSSSRFKILVTSRPYDDIEIDFLKELENLPSIRLRGEEENDQISDEIDRVIRMRVDRLARDLLLDGQTKGQLETRLLEMKHRTYLWLHLATQSIYETYRNSLQLEHASISLLPSSVEDAYEKILNRVSIVQRDIVQKILLIVVGARRPLTIEEMAIALGIAKSIGPRSLSQVQLDSVRIKARIRDWCGLFVFINHERIYLIHQSAKEFLLRSSESALPLSGWKQCLHANEVEKEMARICVQYVLLEDVVSSMPSIVQQLERIVPGQSGLKPGHWDGVFQPFLQYAAGYWPAHLRDAKLSEENDIMANVQALYNNCNSINHPWFRIHCIVQRHYQYKLNEIQLAAFFGHDQVLKMILNSKQYPDLNERDDNTGYTALRWSSERGYAEVVRLLLEHGAIINTPDFGEVYNNDHPLVIAAGMGHENVVEALLNWAEGPNADANINEEIFTAKQLQSALEWASKCGREGIVIRLLASGASCFAKNFSFGSALVKASMMGHQRVVEILIEHGADVNVQHGIEGNAVIAASHHGNVEVLKVLLEHGADVNAQLRSSDNAVVAASHERRVECLKILLEHGADVNASTNYYGSALQALASSFCPPHISSLDAETTQIEVAEVLLNHGADVNAYGKQSSPLSLAEGQEYTRLTELLRQWGAIRLDKYSFHWSQVGCFQKADLK